VATWAFHVQPLSAVSARPPFVVREVDPDAGQAELCALWGANLPALDAGKAARKFELAYRANPVAAGHVLGLHEAGAAALIGAQGLQVREFHRGPHVTRAACLADFTVDAAHRSLGPALTLMRAACRTAHDEGLWVYGFPNRLAEGVCKRVGLQVAGRMARYLKPLRAAGLLRRRGVPAWLARAVALPLDRLLSLRERLACLLAGQDLRIVDTGWDDPGLDEVWRDRPQDLRLSCRDTGSLAWRYRYDMKAPWRLSRVEDRHGAATGYVVWQIEGPYALVSDFLVRRADPALLCALLLHFTLRARQEGAQAISLEFLGRPALRTAILAAGFMQRALVEPVVELPASAGHPFTADEAYLTSFDRDTH
jgi:hypothetical protein